MGTFVKIHQIGFISFKIVYNSRVTYQSLLLYGGEQNIKFYPGEWRNLKRTPDRLNAGVC